MRGGTGGDIDVTSWSWHPYGASIDDTEVRLLGIYLAATYGDASSVTAEDRALTLPPPAP